MEWGPLVAVPSPALGHWVQWEQRGLGVGPHLSFTAVSRDVRPVFTEEHQCVMAEEEMGRWVLHWRSGPLPK